MTIMIGRFTATKLAGVERSGDQVTLSGHHFSESADTRAVDMQQFSGLVDNRDEPVVPVVSEDRPDLDGFYRPTSAQIAELRGTTGSQGLWRWSATLRRVGGGEAVEVYNLPEGERDVSAYTDAEGVGRVWFPSDSYSTRTPSATRSTETGGVGGLLGGNTDVTPTLASFAIKPANYYNASCEVEFSAGGLWYPVVGRRLSDDNPNSLRVSNGLLRLTFNTDGVMSMEVFDGTSWDAVAGPFNILAGFPTRAVIMPVSAEVLRNSPHHVTVAFLFDSLLRVSFSLRRGELHASCVGTSLFTSAGLSWSVAATTAQAATRGDVEVFGGLIRQSVNGATGHRWIIASDVLHSSDLVNGSITTSASASVFPFMVGVELNGSGAVSPNLSTDIRDQYWGIMAESQEVVIR